MYVVFIGGALQLLDFVIEGYRDMFASVSEKAHVQLVKETQIKGIKGERGDWREFLTQIHLGAKRPSDPTGHDPEILRAYLRTIKSETDIAFLKCRIGIKGSPEDMFSPLHDKLLSKLVEAARMKNMQGDYGNWDVFREKNKLDTQLFLPSRPSLCNAQDLKALLRTFKSEHDIEFFDS